MQHLNRQWDTAVQRQVEVVFDALRCTVRTLQAVAIGHRPVVIA